MMKIQCYQPKSNLYLVRENTCIILLLTAAENALIG